MTSLEAALQQANPVPEPLRLVDSAESSAVALLVREEPWAPDTGPRAPDSPPISPAMPRRLRAFALGLAATLAMIGLVFVIGPGRSGGPIDLASFEFPTEQVPPFTATIEYDLNPNGTRPEDFMPAGARVTGRMSFVSPEQWLYEVLSVDPTAAAPMLEPPFLTVRGDGANGWTTESPGAEPSWGENPFSAFGHLLWDSGTYQPWDEVCTTGNVETLGTAAIAGRETVHARCTTLEGDYELWVDTGTGIVMKANGAIESWHGFAPDGGFEIVELSLDEVVLPPPPGEGPVPSGLAPFHALVAGWPSRGGIQEVWYQNDGTWRVDVIESNPNYPLEAGSFIVYADGRLQGCEQSSSPYCFEEDEGTLEFLPISVVPDGALTDECELVGEEQILGRSAEHYACSSDFGLFPYGSIENIVGGSDSPTEYWVDAATSMVLRYDSRHRDIRLEELEFDPQFPPGTFDFEPLKSADGCDLTDPVCEFWTNAALVRGEPAPTFSGPLLDGSTFRLEDLRGRPAVVFHWGTGVTNLEQSLDDFQALSEKWAGEVGFVGTPINPAAEVGSIIERGGYGFANLTCTDEGAAGTVFLCDPSDVMSLWEIGWPFWVVLDADGRVFDAAWGNVDTFVTIDELITAVVASEG